MDPKTMSEEELLSWLKGQTKPCPCSEAKRYLDELCEACRNHAGEACAHCGGTIYIFRYLWAVEGFSLGDVLQAETFGIWKFNCGEDDWFCELTVFNREDEEAESQAFKSAGLTPELAALRVLVKRIILGG